MSCKKESDYQKFLKEWKAKHLGLASSPEMRKNWLKHASVDWNKKKNELEAENKKKVVCNFKPSTSVKFSGTPLRLSTADSASSLGLSPVLLPNKKARTLQQCKIDLAAQEAILLKRNATLCGNVCRSQQQQRSPRLLPASTPRLSPASIPQISYPVARVAESDEDKFIKRLLASGRFKNKDITRAKKIYQSLETKERRDNFLSSIESKNVRRSSNMQLIPYVDVAKPVKLSNIPYFDDEEKAQFYKKSMGEAGLSREDTDRLWSEKQKYGPDEPMLSAFRMHNRPQHRLRFF